MNSLTTSYSTTSQIRFPAVPLAFAVFLYLVLVGFNPFMPRTVETVLAAEPSGNVLRQSSFAIMLIAFLVLSMRSGDFRRILVVPTSITIVLIWCLASAFWSLDPTLTLRRATLTAIIVLIVFLAVDGLGYEKTLNILWKVLTVLLIVNLVSVAVLPQALHFGGDIESADLAGNWRGLHFHKNIAGPVAALSALLFLEFAIKGTRRRLNFALFLGATLFVYGSQSKTAIVLLGVSLTIGLAYRITRRSLASSRLFRRTFLVILLAISILAFGFYEQVSNVLSDPTSLTGRGAIWRVAWEYVTSNPIFGSGFGAFWQLGDNSAIRGLFRTQWVLNVAHTHNGYLHVLVTIGAVGLILTIYAFIFVPLWRLLRYQGTEGCLPFSWMVFLLGENVTEPRLLQLDQAEWVFFLLAAALAAMLSRTVKHNASTKIQGATMTRVT